MAFAPDGTSLAVGGPITRTLAGTEAAAIVAAGGVPGVVRLCHIVADVHASISSSTTTTAPLLLRPPMPLRPWHVWTLRAPPAGLMAAPQQLQQLQQQEQLPTSLLVAPGVGQPLLLSASRPAGTTAGSSISEARRESAPTETAVTAPAKAAAKVLRESQVEMLLQQRPASLRESHMELLLQQLASEAGAALEAQVVGGTSHHSGDSPRQEAGAAGAGISSSARPSGAAAAHIDSVLRGPPSRTHELTASAALQELLAASEAAVAAAAAPLPGSGVTAARIGLPAHASGGVRASSVDLDGHAAAEPALRAPLPASSPPGRHDGRRMDDVSAPSAADAAAAAAAGGRVIGVGGGPLRPATLPTTSRRAGAQLSGSVAAPLGPTTLPRMRSWMGVDKSAAGEAQCVCLCVCVCVRVHDAAPSTLFG